MIGRGDFWTVIHHLAERDPAEACEAVGHYLARRLALAEATGNRDPFAPEGTIGQSQFADSVLRRSALGAPEAFVRTVLPWVLQVAQENAAVGEAAPVPDNVWRMRWPGETYSMRQAVLQGTETALREMAVIGPEAFERTIQPMLVLDLDTPQFLVTRGYAAYGTRFADAAAHYLLQNAFRLRSGYISEPHWATRELLAAITPHCSDTLFMQLECHVLGYYPLEEVGYKNRSTHGYAQFVLLGAFDGERRGATATRRFQELCRKFGSDTPVAPMGAVGGLVKSPVPDAALAKMTDEQWLSAIATHSEDATRQIRGSDIIGGASQLAQQMQRQAEAEPERFVRLTLRIPDDANPVYFDAVLRGVAASGDRVSPEDVADLCDRCHRLPGRPCGRALTLLLDRVAGKPLPVRILDVLGWYATDDLDPERELWRTKASGGGYYYGGEIESAGLNSVRGGAANAVAQLIFADPDRAGHLRPVLDRLVADDSIAVRSMAVRGLTAMLSHDRVAAVGLFVRLCDAEDTLLATRGVELFLRFAVATHFTELEPILLRMLVSSDAEVVRAGARQACIASLDLPEARSLADRCLSGQVAMRLGAAEVYSANLQSAGLRVVCEQALRQLFLDSDPGVRSAAAQCFRNLEGGDLGSFGELVHTFVASPAFADAYPELLEALDQMPAALPDVVCQVAGRFLDLAGSSVSDVRTRAAAEADQVANLVVRAYSQAEDQAIRGRCLDLIDRMTESAAWGLQPAIAEFERR